MALMLRVVACCLVAASLALPAQREGSHGGLLQLNALRGSAIAPPGWTGHSKPDFHKRGGGGIPDVKGQSFKMTVKCTQERDELAKLLDITLAEKKAKDAKCEADVKQYMEEITAKGKNIGALRQIVKDKLDESELKPKYTAFYKSIMCSKIYNAFVKKNDYARIDVIAVCDGKKTMSAAFVQVQDEAPGAESQKSSASAECFQSKPLQQQVDSTKLVIQRSSDACETKKAKLRAELLALNKEEDALFRQYHGHKSQEGAIQIKAANTVKGNFCSIIRQHMTVSEVVIEAYFTQNCVEPPPYSMLQMDAAPKVDLNAKMPLKAQAQGFSGKKVQHVDKKTATGDWRSEYGPKVAPKKSGSVQHSVASMALLVTAAAVHFWH